MSEIPYREIIDYLNERANTSFRHTTKLTQKYIHARWNEKFTLDDFKAVIDIKCQQWLNDSRMSGYLRPQTLFSGNFEGYLQEANRVKKQQQQRATQHKTLEEIENELFSR